MLPFAHQHDPSTPPPYSQHSHHASFPPSTRAPTTPASRDAALPSSAAARLDALVLAADTDSASSASRPSTDSADGTSSASGSASSATGLAGFASFRNRAGPGGGAGPGAAMSRLSSGAGTAASSLSASSSSIAAMAGTASALAMSALEDRLAGAGGGGGGASSSASSTVFTYGGGSGCTGGAWSGDEGSSFGLGLEPGSSRVSSRAHSPAPVSDGGFDGYLSYRAGSRNRSRNTSGYNTPVEKEHAYGPECESIVCSASSRPLVGGADLGTWACAQTTTTTTTRLRRC